MREQVYAETDGRGADVIIDPLGGEVFEAAVRALAWCGRLVVIGFAAGGIPALRTNYLLMKNIEVSGLQITDYRKRRPDGVAHGLFRDFRVLRSWPRQAGARRTLRAGGRREALAAVRDRRVDGRAVLRLRAD